MENYFKKIGQILLNRKKTVILIVTSLILIAVLSPKIKDFSVKDVTDNQKTINDQSNRDNQEFKKTNYNEYVYVSFYWIPRYPDPGETVTFYCRNYGNNSYINSARWNFGDGTTGYGYTTTHNYEEKGSYRVTLDVTAWDSEDGYNWGSTSNTVKVGADPFPEITFTPENPSPGEKVTFEATKSSDPDGRITSYNWSYYNIEDPKNVTKIGSSKIIDYTWEKQGIYAVSLTIKDDDGNNNTINKIVHVSILKLGGFNKLSRGLSFEIRNNGNSKVKNLRWGVKINKYSIFGVKSKVLYQKNDTTFDIDPNFFQRIEVKDIRRAFCKIKLEITAKADNAIEISKTFYGLIFGKYIYLSETNFINPYGVITISGILIALVIAATQF